MYISIQKGEKMVGRRKKKYNEIKEGVEYRGRKDGVQRENDGRGSEQKMAVLSSQEGVR